jgi:hypothetical protein
LPERGRAATRSRVRGKAPVSCDVSGSAATGWWAARPVWAGRSWRAVARSGLGASAARSRADQLPDLPKYVAGELVELGGGPSPICPGETFVLAVQVPFGDGDLVPEREDLGVFWRGRS